MNEKEIIKLIKSKLQAIDKNLFLSTELIEIKEKIEQFLDQNFKGDGLLPLRYRKFKLDSKPRTLWSDTNGFPIGGKDWIYPYIDFF